MPCTYGYQKLRRISRCLGSILAGNVSSAAAEACNDQLDPIAISALRRLSCSAVLGGHFGPFLLRSLQKRLQDVVRLHGHERPWLRLCRAPLNLECERCIVLMRHPVARMISHFSFFAPQSNIHLGIDQFMKSNGVAALLKHTGNNAGTTILRTDEEQNWPVEHILTQSRHCFWGHLEKLDSFLALLEKNIPGFRSLYPHEKVRQPDPMQDRIFADLNSSDLVHRALAKDFILFGYSAYKHLDQTS
jgi:hypothetical protein